MFLVLSAQYEATRSDHHLAHGPHRSARCLVFLAGAGQVLNIYAQVGLVMLIGLAEATQF